MPGNDPIDWARDVAGGLGDAFEKAATGGGSSKSSDSEKSDSDKSSSDKSESEKK
jgi:hypothetical protein